MKRIFQRDEKLTLEADNHSPVEVTVTLVSKNQESIAFTLDQHTAIRDMWGGMAITKAIPCSQDDDGRLTDLFGTEWRIL